MRYSMSVPGTPAQHRRRAERMKGMRLLVPAAILAAGLSAAACGGGSGGGGAESSAQASAHAVVSALSADPALQKSEKQALRKLQGCTDSGTNGQLTWSVNLADPQQPKFAVTHWS